MSWGTGFKNCGHLQLSEVADTSSEFGTGRKVTIKVCRGRGNINNRRSTLRHTQKEHLISGVVKYLLG